MLSDQLDQITEAWSLAPLQEESDRASHFQVEVFAELGEVINGTKPAHREKTTVFKSLGKLQL